MRAVAALVALASLGAGCGSTTTSTSAPPAVSSLPAGSPFSGDRFTTAVPQGWQSRLQVTSEVQRFAAQGEVEFLISPNPAPASPAPLATADIVVLRLKQLIGADKLELYLDSVRNQGAFNVSAPKLFVLDGISGSYVTYDRLVPGADGEQTVTVESQDMVVDDQGQTYDIVLSTTADQFPVQLSALREVLAAWQWK